MNDIFQPQTSCAVQNVEFIVSEQEKVNSDNSRAMSWLTFLLFKLNTLHKETLTNRQTLSQPNPWCNDRGVLNLYDRGFSFERNCVLRRWESETLK